MLNQDFVSLQAVNRQIRAEVLDGYLSYSELLHFLDSPPLIRELHTQSGPHTWQHITRVHVDFIERYASSSIDKLAFFGCFLTRIFPKLQCLYLLLIPRTTDGVNAVTGLECSRRWSREWGERTSLLLSSLQHMTPTVQLELRFACDCEYFEQNYVGKRGWVWLGGD